jgi:hypothetical protein
MDKSKISEGKETKEFKVRLESNLTGGNESLDYTSINISLPACDYIMAYKKGFFDRDFIIAFARCRCNAEFLKKCFEAEDEKNAEKYQLIDGKYVFDH